LARAEKFNVRAQGKEQVELVEMPPALAPPWPEESLLEIASLFFQICCRDVQSSMHATRGEGEACPVTADDWALVWRCIDELEALAVELAPLATQMEEAGTSREPRRQLPEPDLIVDDATFDGIAHAMFERYQVFGRVDKECFNKIGMDMERSPDTATMPDNIWDKICDDVGAATEAGFTFFQFVDFFSSNRHGLAQLHAGVYAVNLDSVCRRPDWEEKLWAELVYQPGARVRLGAHTPPLPVIRGTLFVCYDLSYGGGGCR
jgi:hypothetical protein